MANAEFDGWKRGALPKPLKPNPTGSEPVGKGVKKG
jgi:hypothetical protein